MIALGMWTSSSRKKKKRSGTMKHVHQQIKRNTMASMHLEFYNYSPQENKSPFYCLVVDDISLMRKRGAMEAVLPMLV